MHVTVVGAGIIGSAVAYELASRGARVSLYDPRPNGGATYASAGILAPYIEGHSASLLKLGVCSLGAYDPFLGRVSADAGLPVEYRRCGSLHAAFSAGDAGELAGIARRLRAAGVACEELAPQPAHQVEPALAGTIASALRIEPHAYVNVDGLMTALRAACARLGVARIHERIAEVGVGAPPAADAFVIAAGSWSGQVRAGDAPPVPVKPIRGQRLQLRCGSPAFSQILWGPRCYLVPWLDGRVLVGATVEDVGFDERSTDTGVNGLLAAASELVPALAEARLEDVRVGLRPLVAGELPVIGRSSTMRHVFYATGHYRNGVLLAPLTATLIADLVLDGREHPDLAFVRPDRYGL